MSLAASGTGVSRTPPFPAFFALAAMDAIFGVGAWAPTLMGLDAPWPAGSDLVDWHAREMLFGALAAVLSGFLLTALPRWTRRDIPVWSVRTILVLWLAGRLAPLAPNPFAFAAALPAIALTLVAGFHVVAARDRRNVMTIALLAAYTVAGVAIAAPIGVSAREGATRAAVAAIVGLVMIIGGRVLPALAIRYDQLCGEPPPRQVERTIARFATLSAAVGLVGWLALPDGDAKAIALFCAAAGQTLRMVGWFERRTATSPALRALFLAYAAIPAGFVLLAVQALAPERVPEGGGLHLWMAGGFGGMALAIMSSMIRKRSNLAFTTTHVAAATTLSWLAAVLLRMGAAFAPAPAPWLIAAACFWTAGFGLFLFDFRAPLLGRLFTR